MKLKHIFAQTGILLSVICLLTSCAEELAELNKGNNTLVLTADKQEINLKESDATQTAVTLKWTSGTNYGTSARMNYKLELNNTANDTETAPLFDKSFNDQELSYTFTVRELNDYLHNANISLNYGETLDVQAKLTAEVSGYEEYTQTASVTLKIATYEPVAETLYLCGDATDGGWDASQMQALALENNQQPGIFSVVAQLTADKEFKFFTEKDLLSTAYVRTADNGTELRESVTRDYFGFLNWLVFGGFAAKGAANLMDKGCKNLFNIKKEGKGLKHWLNDLSLKTHAEIAAKGKEFAHQNLKKLNIAHAAGLAYSAITLGVLLPMINDKMTRYKAKKQQQNLTA